MCGIVGVVMKGKQGLFMANDNIFFEMLYADALRGMDSTGFIGIENDTTWHIAKEAVEATWVWPQIKADDVGKATYARGKAVIGHNRKKTQGAISDENAHPFTVGNHFGLVHNGTLQNHRKLAEKEVDSEALAVCMEDVFQHDDYKTRLEELLGRVDGAYALAMYEQRKHCMYLLRNSERPLALLETYDAWYFCSEGLMAHWILSRNGYDMSKVTLKSIPPHHLYKFDLQKSTLEIEELVVKKAMAPIKHTPVVGALHGSGAVTLTKTDSGAKHTVLVTSKQQFKQLKKTLNGKVISFWLEDWIETNYPKTIDSGETEIDTFGRHNDWDINHTIHTTLNLKVLSIQDPNTITSLRWLGTIYDMDWDAKSKLVHVYVRGAKPVVKQITGLRERLKGLLLADVYKEFREKQDDPSTSEMVLSIYSEVIEDKEDAVWGPKGVISKPGTGNYKGTVVSMEDVIAAAKSRGEILTQEIRNGKCCLVDKLGDVLYEDSITLN